MPAKLTRTDDALEVSLGRMGGSEFQQSLAAIKAVPGRRFDFDRKVWLLPNEPEIAERLFVTIRPEADAKVLAWVKQHRAENFNELVTPLKPAAEVRDSLRIPWLDKLHEYQIEAVAHAVEQRRLIIADDMGLGKSLEALSTVAEHEAREGERGPKLIVAPNSVKGSWSREIKTWLGPDEPHVIVDGSSFERRGQQLRDGIAGNAWCIVNWEQIRVKRQEVKNKAGVERVVYVPRQPLFERTPWTAAIADEAHRAQNRKSLQTRGLWRIQPNLRLALTGTPIMGSPDQLWALLRWLFPDEYTSYWRFFSDYVEHYEGKFGKIITGVRNADQLRFELTTRLIRRTKGDVLDLPEKVRQTLPVTLLPKQRALYAQAEADMWVQVEQDLKSDNDAKRRDAAAFMQAAESNDRTVLIQNGAVRTVRLRQIASTPATLGAADESAKLDTTQELILDNQPKQFVVFTEFVPTAMYLAHRLQKAGLTAAAFTGAASSEERTRMIERFQAGDIDVIVGTIPAMREGVTLTAADTVIFIERHWNPAINTQCEDRLHRIGQENHVTVIILEAEDSVDVSKVSPSNALKELVTSTVIRQDEVKHERL